MTPARRRPATTSSPWRRSATCIASNRAKLGGRRQAASASAFGGPHAGDQVRPNWRALRAHQDVRDTEDERAEARD